MLIIQSPYDEWGLGYQVEATCYSGMHPPYSLQNCNKTAIEDIEKYRRTAIQAIYKIKGNRKNVGVWGPACVQHGFLDEKSFKNQSYKVPTDTGYKLYDAVTKFVEDPENAPWLLDEGLWPSNNTGCNGIPKSLKTE